MSSGTSDTSELRISAADRHEGGRLVLLGNPRRCTSCHRKEPAGSRGLVYRFDRHFQCLPCALNTGAVEPARGQAS